jgi:hypothetical protein
MLIMKNAAIIQALAARLQNEITKNRDVSRFDEIYADIEMRVGREPFLVSWRYKGLPEGVIKMLTDNKFTVLKADFITDEGQYYWVKWAE